MADRASLTSLSSLKCGWTRQPSEVAIPNYLLLCRDRSKHGGGVALYVNDSIVIRSYSAMTLPNLCMPSWRQRRGVHWTSLPVAQYSDHSLAELSQCFLALSFQDSKSGDFSVDLMTVGLTVGCNILRLTCAWLSAMV